MCQVLRALKLSSRFYTAAVSLLLVPLVLYFTVIGGSPFLGVYQYPGRVRFQCLAGAVLVIWLIWKWAACRDLLHTSLDGPIIVLLIVFALSTLFSTDPRLSLERSLAALAYALAFYLLLDLKRYPRIWTGLVNAVLMVAGVVCILGFLQLGWWYRDLPSVAKERIWHAGGPGVPLPRLSALGSSNGLAAYLLLTVPLGLRGWIAAKSSWARILLGGGLLASALVFFLTRSRGGIVGLIAALVVGLWLSRGGQVPGRLRGRRVVVLLLILALGAGSAVVLAQRGLDLAGGTVQVRYESWRAAVLTLRDHPFLGSGPGTFGAELLHYRDPHRLSEIHSHAHSMYLTLAAETGVSGLGALIWLIAVFAVTLCGRLRSLSRFALPAACVTGLAGWAAHSFVDSFLDRPGIMLHVLFLTAGALPHQGVRGRTSRSRQLVAVTLLPAIIVVASAWINWGFAAYHGARVAAIDGSWEEVRRWLDTAVARDPHNLFYGRQRAFAYGYLACSDSVYLSAALKMTEGSLQDFEDSALDHANIAALRWRAGDLEAAIREMRRAHELRPDRALYVCTQGRYLEAAGRPDEAIHSYASCIAQEPELLESRFWDATSWRAGGLPRIVRRAEQELGARADFVARARLRFYAGDLREALEDIRLYRQIRPDAVDACVEEARILDALGREEEALQLLERTLEQAPGSGSAWLVRGVIQLEQENWRQASAALETSAELKPGPAVFYRLGQLAEAQGDSAAAIENYRRALAEATRPHITQFAPWVAHRFPLPTERLPCLTPLRPYDAFAAPALALGRLLEMEGRCDEAAEVYQRILLQEPYLSQARGRLEQLPCLNSD